jgi:glycosyltransferase EpsF
LTTAPIRVLQILGIVAGGGVEAVIMNYYEHIDRNKVQFDFVVHNDSPVNIEDKVEAMGGKVYTVTPYTKNIFMFMHDIYIIVKHNHYSIVHSNMNTLSVFSLFAAWLAGAKIRILHNHSTSVPSETKRNVMKVILRPFAKLFANRYFACSRLAATWMYGKSCMESGNVTIINNAIDLRKYAFDEKKRKSLRDQLGITEGTFVIGHVGRFMYQKNHEFLIDVFAEAVKQEPNMRLLLIGEGPLKKNMEDKVDSLHIKDKVLFLGLRSDVQNLYNAMDLFVLPSYYEGLPVVGVETQANGLPLLVSTNVTDELYLTDTIEYRSLKEDKRSWVSCILKYKEKRVRKNTFEDMTVKGFNIEYESQKLEKMYCKIKY